MTGEVYNLKSLDKVGGIAALLAGVLFRRNIGAEISLFADNAVPESVVEWYSLLQSSPFIGLSYLAIFDVVNYALVGPMFLALCVALWKSHNGAILIAISCGIVGIALSFASNIAFSMLSLSQQYMEATSEAQKTILLAAGQSLLSLPGSLATVPGTGVYMSLLLIALASLLFSAVMLRSSLFGRATAFVGILASACDLVYCLTFAIAPFLTVPLIATGGLFWMIWHLLVARRLLQLSKEKK